MHQSVPSLLAQTTGTTLFAKRNMDIRRCRVSLLDTHNPYFVGAMCYIVQLSPSLFIVSMDLETVTRW